MTPGPRGLSRFVASLAALAALSACTAEDRDQPLEQVDTIDIPVADTTTRVNINIDDPTLEIPTTVPVGDGDLLTLVWSDEFDGAQLDPETWFFESGDGANFVGDGGIVGLPSGWGNNELQWYLPDNAQLEDGVLKITARRETVGDFGYTSARITTRDRFAFRYGRIEASIKLPSGQGLWPAFWLLSQDSPYGSWAATGEIDVLEAVNLDGQPGPGGLGGGNDIFGTIHFGGEFPANQSSTVVYTPSEDVTGGFNTYALEWDEFEIRWYFNGILYGVQNSWESAAAPYPAPFDQPFHILLNLAVGGNLPGAPNGSTPFPATMEVDWVRVYSGEESAGEPAAPGIIPDDVIYASNPNETVDLVFGVDYTGFEPFGSGSTFNNNVTFDSSFSPAFGVTTGSGYGAQVGQYAIVGFAEGFAAGYERLVFKAKNLNNDLIRVNLLPDGDYLDIDLAGSTYSTSLGDGWYQVVVPIANLTGAATATGLLFETDNTAASPFTFLLTDFGFSGTAGGGGEHGAGTAGVFTETATESTVAVTSITNSADFGGNNTIADPASTAIPAFEGDVVLSIDYQDSGSTFGGVVLNFGGVDLTAYDTLNFTVDTSGISGFADLTIQIEPPGEGAPGTNVALSAYTPVATSGNWATYEIPLADFTATDFSAAGNLGFWNPTNGTGLAFGTLYVDDVYFSTEASGGGGGGGGGTGLVVNSGFDDGFTGWETFDNGGSVTIAANGGSDGGPAANLNATSPGNPTIKQTLIGAGVIGPNQTFSVTFDWRGTAANGGVITFQVFSEQANGGVTKTDLVQGGDAFPADWTTVGPLNFTSAGTAAEVADGLTLEISAICGGVAGCVSDLFIDNINVEIVGP
ncbi:glycoside hydrolase family 16 protein [Wenzhouxiangella sp. XN24]|uniref:glycoside hydrolase family 16 protein n=1 Tax=Wenzhouxiangella sp. XN24 TaxID=2713569 RepID=UPI0013E9D699|nr:glycoside hydrolase family 16 protein [Wenzhouxiangella sp. XN24]NGX15313.1 glycoside hydrolase family 16 protein [Wenzhouxiangella sp. XN24]